MINPISTNLSADNPIVQMCQSTQTNIASLLDSSSSDMKPETKKAIENLLAIDPSENANQIIPQISSFFKAIDADPMFLESYIESMSDGGLHSSKKKVKDIFQFAIGSSMDKSDIMGLIKTLSHDSSGLASFSNNSIENLDVGILSLVNRFNGDISSMSLSDLVSLLSILEEYGSSLPAELLMKIEELIAAFMNANLNPGSSDNSDNLGNLALFAKAANFLDGSGTQSSSTSQPLMNSAVPPIEMIDTDAEFTQPHHKPHPPHHRPGHSLEAENIDETSQAKKPKKSENKTDPNKVNFAAKHQAFTGFEKSLEAHQIEPGFMPPPPARVESSSEIMPDKHDQEQGNSDDSKRKEILDQIRLLVKDILLAQGPLIQLSVLNGILAPLEKQVNDDLGTIQGMIDHILPTE